jgi:hypothetical protein
VNNEVDRIGTKRTWPYRGNAWKYDTVLSLYQDIGLSICWVHFQLVSGLIWPLLSVRWCLPLSILSICVLQSSLLSLILCKTENIFNACIWSRKSLRKCLVTNSSKKHTLTSTTVNKKTRRSRELNPALMYNVCEVCRRRYSNPQFSTLTQDALYPDQHWNVFKDSYQRFYQLMDVKL